MIPCMQIIFDATGTDLSLYFAYDMEEITALDLILLSSPEYDALLSEEQRGVRLCLQDEDETQVLTAIVIEGRVLTFYTGELSDQRNCLEVENRDWLEMLQAVAQMQAQHPFAVTVDGRPLAEALVLLERARAERAERWQHMLDTMSERSRLLLTLGGDGLFGSDWLDYAAMGFNVDDLPSLQALVAHDSISDDLLEEPEIYASLHAWRVLGVLADPASLPVLYQLYSTETDADWLLQLLPGVLACFGEANLAYAERMLNDRALPLHTRTSVGEVLVAMAGKQPELRDKAVATLVAALHDYGSDDPGFNAATVADLVHLRAEEQAPLMERMFADDKVDWSYVGDWEEVQLDLGLLQQRLTPRPNFHYWGKSAEEIAAIELMQREMALVEAREREARKKADKDRKSKRKQQARARKQSRKGR